MITSTDLAKLNSVSLQHAAETYASWGWPIFPLVQASKRPLTKTGFHEASADLATIREWWQKAPYSNIGLACQEIVVLDVDVKADKRGDRSLVELVRDHGPIPHSVQAMTASGGAHHFFSAVKGTVKRAADSPQRKIPPLGPSGRGLDICGTGGYVVLAPSRTDAGSYSWLDDGATLVPLSGWLKTAMEQAGREEAPVPIATTKPRWTDDVSARANRAINYVARIPSAIAGSGGHPQTYDVALVLVKGFSLPLDVARVILADYSARCSPPWSAREIEHKLASAARSNRVPDGYLIGAGI